MIYSRSGRIEERKQQKRLILAVGGMVALIAFFAIFGLKLLVGFSLLVDRIRGSSPAPAVQPALILPPTLDPLPVATRSATIKVTGSGQPEMTAVLYLNNQEVKKVPVPKNGTFTTSLSGLVDGTNTISARIADGKGNTSEFSNVLSITVKKTPPALEITAPEDASTVTGESNLVAIEGLTDDEASVTINGRVVVLRSDNSFSHQYPLNDGENKLTIVATDMAGNITTVEYTVTYHR